MAAFEPPPGYDDRYGVEQGEVMVWVQTVLLAESQRASDAVRRAERRPIQQAELPVGVVRDREAAAARHPSAYVAGAPAERKAVAAAARAVPVTWAGGLVDPASGAGSLRALRRDLVLEESWPGAASGGPNVVLAFVDPLPLVRRKEGPGAADQVLHTVVEAASRVLRGRDRIYRCGVDHLAIMLPGSQPEANDAIEARLSDVVATALLERGLPQVRLRLRPVAPEALKAQAPQPVVAAQADQRAAS